jgi:hypothetical protein
MPPAEGRLLSRKMKNDASKTIGKRAKKHHDTKEFYKLDIEAHATTIECDEPHS